MYFLMIRPQQKKLRDHKAMVEADDVGLLEVRGAREVHVQDRQHRRRLRELEVKRVTDPQSHRHT
jgi:hypothetical protein